MRKQKVLVTGGTGFLGAALVHRLVKDGFDVRVLDNCFRSSATRLESIRDDIDMQIADIRDIDAVNLAVKGMDTVMHLAAINGTENFYNKPELVLDVGVKGMLNILDACKANNVGDLIVASSSEAYQVAPIIPSNETVPLIVPDPLNPRYSYGGSKIISELLTFNYGRTGFDRAIAFRPHNVYGPDMAWEHVLPQFILRAHDLDKQHPTGPIPFEIQGDGTETRAFVHIDDMIEGLMVILDKGKHMNIYHVGNPEELQIREVAEKVVQFFEREAEIISTPLLAGSPKRRCPDISKLVGLGYTPKVSFDQGLPSIANWYKTHANQRKCA